jgi:uncharacterized membrane protein AbrB (regulator of aidB expression)
VQSRSRSIFGELGISTPVRDTIQPIIATMIGSTFTPLVMRDLLDSAIATPFMLANTILIAGCVLAYLHRSRQFDHGAVYLSSVPGGMSQLVQLIVSTMIIVIASFASALLLSVCSGFSLATSLLIITPGGLGETSLIAMVFNTNPKLVAIQHTIRILFLYFFVPFFLQCWWLPMMTRTKPATEPSPCLETCGRMDRAA